MKPRNSPYRVSSTGGGGGGGGGVGVGGGGGWGGVGGKLPPKCSSFPPNSFMFIRFI